MNAERRPRRPVAIHEHAAPAVRLRGPLGDGQTEPRSTVRTAACLIRARRSLLGARQALRAPRHGPRSCSRARATSGSSSITRTRMGLHRLRIADAEYPTSPTSEAFLKFWSGRSRGSRSTGAARASSEPGFAAPRMPCHNQHIARPRPSLTGAGKISPVGEAGSDDSVAVVESQQRAGIATCGRKDPLSKGV